MKAPGLIRMACLCLLVAPFDIGARESRQAEVRDSVVFHIQETAPYSFGSPNKTRGISPSRLRRLPVQQGTTHSGSLTYSIPVLPAASAKGAHSILIAYNSQSGRCYL